PLEVRPRLGCRLVSPDPRLELHPPSRGVGPILAGRLRRAPPEIVASPALLIAPSGGPARPRRVEDTTSSPTCGRSALGPRFAARSVAFGTGPGLPVPPGRLCASPLGSVRCRAALSHLEEVERWQRPRAT